MRTRPPLPTTLAVAGLVAVALVPLHQVFDGWDWALPVLGAAVLGACLACAVESVRRRPPVVVGVTAGVAGATVWTLATVFTDRLFATPLDGELWRDLRDGVFDGWSALLEDATPLTDPVAAEVFATFLAWSAAAVGVHVAARRASALAAVGMTAGVLLLTSVVALPQQLTPVVVGVGAGVCALLLIATLGGAREDHWPPARLVSLTAMVVAAGILATVAGELVAGVAADPVDPRDGRSEAVDALEVPDLLATLEILQQGDTPLLTVDADTLPPELRLRLQVYDRHDGERWLPVSRFDEVAAIPEPQELPPGEVVDVTLTEEDLYPGPWVPLPDRLIDIGLRDLGWNDETQTALRTDRPATYRLSGTVVPADLATGLTVATEVDERYTALPIALPEALRAAAGEAAGAAKEPAGDTGDGIAPPDVALVEEVTDRVRALERSDSAPPGHSLARLGRDLAEGRPTGPEQLASIHALILRSLGVPTRLVVGYRTTDAEVVPAELGLWVEVAVTDLGWVAYDPVPPPSDSPADPGEGPDSPTTSLPSETAVQAQAVPQELGPGEDPGEPSITVDEPLTLTEVLLLTLAVLVLLLVALAVTRAARRSMRRQRGQPAATRVLGAWAEFVDRLRELGAPVAATTTIDDVTFMATAIDPGLGEETQALGDLARAALHGPVEPTDEAGDEAWDRLTAAERTIRAVRGRPTTVRHYLDPRALRHRAPEAPEDRLARGRPRPRASSGPR